MTEPQKEIRDLYKLVKQGKISKEEALRRIHAFGKGLTDVNLKGTDQFEDKVESKLLGYLKSKVAYALKLDIKKIRNDVPLEDYGLDSAMVMKVTGELEQDFGTLPKTLFFEYQTLESLSNYFKESHWNKLIQIFGIQNGNGSVSLQPADKDRETLKEVERINDSQELHQNVDEGEKTIETEMAIVGLSGRYPQAKNMEEFWENLQNRKDCITEIPEDRWNHSAFYNSDRSSVGTTYCRYGGFISEVDGFDPSFFKISPKEAKFIDPQERLFLECVYTTLEDAGYTAKSISKGAQPASVGVFVGVMFEEYHLYAAQEAMLGNHYSLPSNPSSIANRVSYYFNFEGPSMAIDSMCSSSLTAIHLACKSIQNGDCEMAIAGGVNVSIHPNKYVLLSQASFLSEKGRCASFADGGDGYIPGEGVGAILIKEKSKAIADGDHIYAIIKGSSVNHGGKAKNFTVPSPVAQSRVIAKALKSAKTDPRMVSYIEAHGTGTELGDPIEIAGLNKVFSTDENLKNYCAIGSVKSNIGHCESAAGIAGVSKVLLQMKYKTLVPSIHSDQLNRNIDFENSAFKIQRDVEPWENPLIDIDGNGKKRYPRIAGVSSFGAGGSNAHIILEEFSNTNYPSDDVHISNEYIILFSAKSEDQIKVKVKELLTYITKENLQEEHLVRIAYTLQNGREHFEERLAFIVSDINQLKTDLQKFLNNEHTLYSAQKGSVRSNQDLMGLFNSVDELQAIIKGWLKENKIEKLVDLWIKGIEINWSLLYNGNNPSKISLPSYPFDRQKYWMPTLKFSEVQTTTYAKIGTLHPLLQQNVSTLAEQKYSSFFTGKESFLEDHVINGNKILPGVAYLEMVRKAMELATDFNVNDFSIYQLKWLKPFIVPETGKTMYTRLIPSDKEIKVEFYEMNLEREALLCSCKVSPSEPSEYIFPVLQTIKEKVVKSLADTEEIYKMFSGLGFSYGPTHRALKEIKVDGENILASVKIDEAIKKQAPDLMWHTSIFDAILQATAGGKIQQGINLDDNALSLPFSFYEARAFGSVPDEVFVYIEPKQSNNGGSIIQDIYIYDNNGTPVFFIGGFTLRKVSGLNKEQVTSEAVPEEIILSPTWKKLDYGTSNAGQFLFHKVFMDPGINIKQLQSDKFKGNTEVFILESEGRNSAERYIDYALQLFSTIKSHLSLHSGKSSFFQVLVPEGHLFEGLAAAMKSAMMENPMFRGQLILLEPDANINDALMIGLKYPHVPLIKINGGMAFHEVLEEVHLGASEEKSILRKYGVYLITGGAGGLGEIFADFIASNAPECSIILTGRSDENEKIRKILQGLREKGATATYKRVDITNFLEVNRLIIDVTKEFKCINGIIHSAGIIKDNFIIRKPDSDFRDVLGPKVLGTYNIDEATKNLKIDWFVLFSSASGFFGNAGQADYSSGNAFMDHFALDRNRLVKEGKRSGLTSSINWPLWKDGGMKISMEMEKMLKLKTGMHPLPALTGIGQFLKIVNAGTQRAIPLFGDTEFIKREVGINSKVIVEKLAPVISELPEASEVLYRKGLAFFQSMITGYLELSKSADPDANFESFGMDSVMVMQLTRDLESKFGALSKTLFFECQSIRELNDYFVKNHLIKLKEVLQIPDKTILTEGKESGIAGKQEAGTQSLLEDLDTAMNKDLNVGFSNRFRSVEQVNKELRNVGAIKKEKQGTDIAVVAIAGKYPGAKDISELWENLKAGKDCITRVPSDRWDESNNVSNLGGFIDEVDFFDPLFFHISPKEAEVMDPQARLFLENAWMLLENGAYSAERIDQLTKGNVGVFVGVMSNQYPFIESSDKLINAVRTTTAFHSIANRISYFFDFKGPSFTIDSACSSGLTAVHLACKSLLDEECKMAIAGGVNLSIHPDKFTGLAALGMIGADKDSRSFGDGKGYLPSEGVGSLLLKRLSDAEKDGDQILAVIKSTSINHSGRSTGYSIPNPNQQAALMEENFRRSNIHPRSISYAELAVNGSVLGDAIEVSGINKVFRKYTDDKNFCAVGSIKSNLGHGEAVSGIGQITKVILQLYNKQLVPNVKVANVNPNISFENSPFYIQEEFKNWDIEQDLHDTVRRASVNSFGAGGSYSHVILEEYISNARSFDRQEKSARLIIPISARTWSDLKASAQLLLNFFREADDNISLDSIALTLQKGRTAMKYRMACVVSSINELINILEYFLKTDQQKTFVFGGESIYVNDCEVDKPEIKELLAGEEGTLYFQSLIKNEKFEKLAMLWSNGAFNNWPDLNVPSASFVSLPNYPFNRKRFWVDNKVLKASDVTVDINLGQPAVSNPIFKNGTPEIEKLILEFFEKELSLAQGEYSKDSHFMELGLNSLSGRNLVQLIQTNFQVELTSRDLLENSSINKLVEFVGRKNLSFPVEPEKSKGEINCFTKSELSEGQKGLWMLQKSDPTLSSYNVPIALRFPQKSNVDSIRKACEYLLHEHPILRTAIGDVEGIPFMHFPESKDFNFEYLEVNDDSEILSYLRSLSKGVFQLDKNLIRFHLIKKNEDEYYLLIVVHHIIFDGASLPILAKSFIEGYSKIINGEQISGDREAKVDFADFVQWEKNLIQGEQGDKLRDYWKKIFSGSLPVLEMPSDRPRSLVKERKGKVSTFYWESQFSDKIKSFSKSEKINLTTLFLGIYKILLHRYSGEEDIIVGMPSMGRHDSKFANAIGYFVNMIPLRSYLNANKNVSTLLHELQYSLADSLDHGTYPFASIVKALNIPRTNNSPVFQVAFAFQNFMNEANTNRVEVSKQTYIEGIKDIQQEGEYELLLEVYEDKQGFRLIFNFDENLYAESTIKRMASHYGALIESYMHSTDKKVAELDILQKDEYNLVTDLWNNTVTKYNTNRLIHHGFELNAKSNPEAIALVCDGLTMTYKELDERSNMLANFLKEKYQVQRGTKVGIGIRRSFDMIIGLLGILKSGGAYVPLDYQNPADRLKYICESADIALLLLHENLSDNFSSVGLPKIFVDSNWPAISKYDKSTPENNSLATDLAYIIYTSGSTGLPKGVKVAHYPVINLFEWIEKEFHVNHLDRVLFVTSLSFDLSVYDIFGLLNAGGSIHIVKEEFLKDPEQLANIFLKEPITFWDSAPAAMKQLAPFFEGASKLGNPSTLRLVFLSGDWIPLTLPKDIWSNFPNANVISLGGATEATVWSNFYKVKDIDPDWLSIPYGRPIQNAFYYILDANLKPCPINVPGNLYIGGDCLAMGYTDEKITFERFINNPFRKDSSRLYFTGDRARFRPDGNIEFLGRVDHQVKLRGYRIELGEIEAVISAHPEVQEAVALVREDEPGNQLLVAYLLVERGVEVDISDLKKLAAEKLPSYMVPSAYITMSQFPVTVNGKLDRKALPAPGYDHYETNSYVAPETEKEIMLANIWKEVLKLEKVGKNDSLFEIGGDSLIAMQIIAKAARVGLNFTVRNILENPTITMLAQIASERVEIVADQDLVLGDVPLTPVQSWFLEGNFTNTFLWDQKVILRVSKSIDLEILVDAFNKVTKQHDMLRTEFNIGKDGATRQFIKDKLNVSLDVLELKSASDELMIQQAEDLVHSLINDTGTLEEKLVRLFYFTIDGKDFNWLMISIHHLVVDAVSWQYIIEDLKNFYKAISENKSIEEPLKTTSYQYFAERLYQWAASGGARQEKDYWISLLKNAECLPIIEGYDKNLNLEGRFKISSFHLNADVTSNLLDRIVQIYEAKADDILLTALTLAMAKWQRKDTGRWIVSLESHGREELFEEVDLTRTVGWFTSISPVVLSYSSEATIDKIIKQLKEERAGRAANGMYFGILKYINNDADLRDVLSDRKIDLSFNYLGRILNEKDESDFAIVPGSFGVLRDKKAYRPYAVEMDLFRIQGQLHASVKYCEEVMSAERIAALLKCFEDALIEISGFHFPTNNSGKGILEISEEITSLSDSNVESMRESQAGEYSGEAFPLTGLQLAYKIGEKAFFSLDNIVAHEYFEVEYSALDIKRYVNAWKRIIDHHEILRAIVGEDHQLRILSKVPEFKPEIVQYWSLSNEEKTSTLNAYRQRLQNQGPKTDRWPLFEVSIHQYNEDRIIVHLNIAIILIDGLSLRIMLSDLMKLYENPDSKLEKKELSFREYRTRIEEIKNTKDYVVSKLYWKKRIPKLPNPPELPLVKKLNEIGNSDLILSNKQLAKEDWVTIKSIAAKYRLTPSTVLLTVFAKVLSKWSNNKNFTFSILHANRFPVHPEANEVLGNFSTTNIFEADFQKNESFVDLAGRFQNRLQRDLEHYYFSGVEVIAERNVLLKQLHGGIPIALSDTTVFEDNFNEQNIDFGKVNISGAQTPHVYLDCILHLLDGGVNLRWAYQRNAFPEGLINDMQYGNIAALKLLAKSEESWLKPIDIPLSKENMEIREEANSTHEEECLELMHELFVKASKLYPSHMALKSSHHNFTYNELHEFSNQIANVLRREGVKPNQLVAVVMNKGWEQIPASLGILIAGAAYMPVDASFPKERIWNLLQTGDVNVVLTQDGVYNDIEWPEDIKVFKVNKKEFAAEPGSELISIQKREDLAYVIFTSGSTGTPKGVMIDHIGAVNTLMDINSRFKVGSDDKVLAISSLNFDLSVYDIFGTLAAGGTIVMPDKDDYRDPNKLVQWVEKEKVSIWNSVPAFVQMLQEYIGNEEIMRISSLRLIMMSGDWIPVSLPEKLKQILPAAEIYSLGGATEASIWSIIYPITSINPEWRSIPYGKPMVNQTFEILDEELRPVPQWASGDLYIGGIGVAKGYWKDEKRTKESFIKHPDDSRILYKTGDVGRYLPDGNIEFQGRSDNQVKIQGYRVELGEIETILKQHSEVKDCLVADKEILPGEKHLVAYVISENHKAGQLSSNSDDFAILKEYLRQLLPSYMVPSYFMSISEIPVSANGKVNKKDLPLPNSKVGESNFVNPRSKEEIEIAQILKGILNIDRLGVHDSFFDLGGHSISAVRLISGLNKTYKKEFPVSILNEFDTVSALARLVKSEDQIRFSSLIELSKSGDREPFFCIHPIGGHIMSYQELSKHFYDRPFIGIQSPGIVDGKTEFFTVEEMADYYISLIREKQKTGPYAIGGWSFGGIVAYEIARKLEKTGEKVSRLIMIDSYLPLAGELPGEDENDLFLNFISDMNGRFEQLKIQRTDFLHGSMGSKIIKLLELMKIKGAIPEETGQEQLEVLFKVYKANMIAMQQYKVVSIETPAYLIKAKNSELDAFKNHPKASDETLGWNSFTNVTVSEIDGDHYTIFNNEYVVRLAELINKYLAVGAVKEMVNN